MTTLVRHGVVPARCQTLFLHQDIMHDHKATSMGACRFMITKLQCDIVCIGNMQHAICSTGYNIICIRTWQTTSLYHSVPFAFAVRLTCIRTRFKKPRSEGVERRSPGGSRRNETKAPSTPGAGKYFPLGIMNLSIGGQCMRQRARFKTGLQAPGRDATWPSTNAHQSSRPEHAHYLTVQGGMQELTCR